MLVKGVQRVAQVRVWHFLTLLVDHKLLMQRIGRQEVRPGLLVISFTHGDLRVVVVIRERVPQILAFADDGMQGVLLPTWGAITKRR